MVSCGYANMTPWHCPRDVEDSELRVKLEAMLSQIEEYQPIVGLHGHIHECRGAIELGRTVCLNPGSEYSEGILRGVLVNIADGQLKGYQFVAG